MEDEHRSRLPEAGGQAHQGDLVEPSGRHFHLQAGGLPRRGIAFGQQPVAGLLQFRTLGHLDGPASGETAGDGGHARPCLLYSPDGTRPVSRRFFIVPGEARECGDAEELWQAIRDGFRGTVFVPASRGNDLDLPRMCATPDIHIIIMASRASRTGIVSA